jgi:hypothetical protein
MMIMAVFVGAWQTGVTLSSRDVFTCMGWIGTLQITVFVYLFTAAGKITESVMALQRVQVPYIYLYSI